jgi:dUTPase
MHGGLNVDGKVHHSLNEDVEKITYPLMSGVIDEQSVYITHIAGTIDSDEKERLKKLLFRATRGKALTYFDDFEVKNVGGIKQ